MELSASPVQSPPPPAPETLGWREKSSYGFGNLRPGTYVLSETQPGGYLDGKVLSAADVTKLADLESREVLLAKLAGAEGSVGLLKRRVYLDEPATTSTTNFADGATFTTASPAL